MRLLHAFFYSLLWIQFLVNSEVFGESDSQDELLDVVQGIGENVTESIPNNRTCGQKMETYVMQIMDKNFYNVSSKICKE